MRKNRNLVLSAAMKFINKHNCEVLFKQGCPVCFSTSLKTDSVIIYICIYIIYFLLGVITFNLIDYIYIRLRASVRFFYLFRCVLSSVLPLRSVGRSNFDKGRHNLTTLIHKTDIY